MGALLSHMIVIDNKTNFPLEIRKCTDQDNQGLMSRPLLIVEPGNNKPISSTKLFNNWSDTSSPRFFKFYCNEVLLKTLTPRDLSAMKAIIVEMNQNIPSVTAVPYKKTPPDRHSVVPSNIDRTEEPLLSRGSYLKC
ncbi:hypothetical protein A2U01_0005540 [Trifolium medium]|uniref:Uncharacterized protein n=1 Tax=Trifolium medium TaxID=97028 RepID=A0A392MC74_9FABA|nr:hypothetical protein [Trifolium medium]